MNGVTNGAFTRSDTFRPERDGVIPRFFIESITDEMASQREGRAIYFDQERVELIIPGNTLNIVVEIVNASHKDRWPEAYKRFKDGMEMSANGTPLEMWPILKPAQVRELKAMNLFTVENVAAMNDHVTQKMMGGQRLRQLAKAFLDDAAAMSLLTQATADNDRKDQRISELEHKVNELSTLLNTVHRDMMAARDAPNAVAAYVPGQNDPMEAMKQAMPAPAGGQSSLDNLPEPPRRRRQQAAQESAA